MSVPELSKYATSLQSHLKQRYLQNMEKISIDPVNIPDDELDPECLSPIEQSDLFSFLVLETSYYTNDQWSKLVSEKHVVLAKVRQSQRMNDSLVDV